MNIVVETLARSLLREAGLPETKCCSLLLLVTSFSSRLGSIHEEAGLLPESTVLAATTAQTLLVAAATRIHVMSRGWFVHHR